MAEGYDAQIKALLANKDNLVKIKTKDGRSKYAVQMNELKKRMKADGQSFSKALKGVKKQEREGKFDRGAEGKTKKKLRAKMAKEPETIFTSGRHKGSDADIAIEETGIKDVDSASKANISRLLAGQKTKKKKKSVAASR